ncbi:MAG: 16S rRNA (guanine(527)-N(7))-methyltransferase RsmG [Acidobacteriota bacterium]|nr:16S rRNA (guanine(527)-N(7))-methyltransferase RsmG [Acidobacteriota bacterium]
MLDGLERYYQLLAKWNARVNLTAFKLHPGGEDEAVDRLLLEPVAAARYIPSNARSLMDAGSGGGSPAIPLKLAVPHLNLRMVESKTRKAVFLREATRELALGDASVDSSRFEELLARPELHESADVVSIRAVRIETKVLKTLQAFLRPGGRIILFRGPGGVDLSDAVTPPLVWTATYPLLETLRSRLVVLEKARIGSGLGDVPRGTSYVV